MDAWPSGASPLPDSLSFREDGSPLARIARRRSALRTLPPFHHPRAGGTRQWARAACSAEVAHAKREFWDLAHEMNVGFCFDRYLEPDIERAAHLPHERAAARVLEWLGHLQVENWLIARSIGDGMLHTDRHYMRALFERRLKLKRGLQTVLADYRRLRIRGETR